ncbi:hypothetical protein ACSSUR_01310 [Pseudomonas cedrina]|uniref:hypothetical protein n=1 Tax=Pseudomonas cedrina TaxID=651740 RepID=UPI003EDA9BC2
MLNKLGKHWLFLMPLVVFAGYYSLQNFIGYSRYPSEIINKMILALSLCVISYIISYKYLPTSWADRIAIRPFRENTQKYIAYAIIALFVIVIICACRSTAAVPILEAFKGASASELADYRNSFMRGQAGSGQLINYLYAIFLQALMPFAVSYFFWVGHKFRHFVIAIFIIGASLSLSKGIFLCIAAPMIAVYLMKRRWLSAAGVLGGFVVSAALMYFIASGALGASLEKSNFTTYKPVVLEAPKEAVLQSDVPDQYNLFTKKNQTLLIVNRIIWIPYVTALDWFRYQELKMGDSYLLGKSIRPLAYLSDSKRVYLEKEVAELQWGGPSGATSNAVFFADAWLNWGALGVIVYSMLLALTIKLIITSNNKALIAASGFPVWVSCFSALPPVYLSAGLGFLLILAFILRVEVSCAKPIQS